VVVAAACVLMVLLMGVARQQVMVWKDSKTLYEHALEATKKNYLAHSNLAATLMDLDRSDIAERHLIEALRIRPHYAVAHYNLGICLYRRGAWDKAAEHFSQAVLENPLYTKARIAWGDALLRKGDYRQAILRYEEALLKVPDRADVHNNLGIALAAIGRNQEAMFHFKEALKYDAADDTAKRNLAKVLTHIDTVKP